MIEIERLRAAVELLRDLETRHKGFRLGEAAAEEAAAEIERLRAENERLRAEIAEWKRAWEAYEL